MRVLDTVDRPQFLDILLSTGIDELYLVKHFIVRVVVCE